MFENKRITERDATQKERGKKERESASKRERESRGDDGAQRATDTVQQQQEQQKAEGLGSGVSALPC